MIPTLLHRARNRRRDLLYEPRRVATDMERILDSVAPDAVLVDQLAFGATAALRGLGRPFASFHPGHPSAISVGWPYGYPLRIPRRLRVDHEGLAELKQICLEVGDRFTAEYNDAIAAIDHTVDPVSDALAAVLPLRTLVNYPAELGSSYGAAADTESAWLGRVFDPNFDSAATVAELAHTVLAGDAVARVAQMGRHLRARPGQTLAADLVEESMELTTTELVAWASFRAAPGVMS